MRRIHKPIPLFLAVCLTLSLCACGGAGRTSLTGSPAASAAPGGAASSGFDIPGEELDAAAGLEAEARVVTDGLEGRYYNDYLRMTLTLDGSGGCMLAGVSGKYSAADGALTLSFDAGQEAAVIDADGDITIDGRTGYFLRDWEKWGITEAEAGSAPAVSAAHTGAIDNGDGTFRFRDFENGVAFTYPAGMTVLRDALIGGVAVFDGGSGYITGRNVTELYSTHSGSDDEFVEDYVKSFVFADFGLLYGSLSNYDGFTILHEGIEGRLAAAVLALKSAGAESFVQAKVILYTSTYLDGTVNYICKTVFAGADGLDALEAAVSDMGAVRLVED